MSWKGLVWLEAGNYGPGGIWQAQKKLGEFTFPNVPDVGMVLEIRGEDYQVVESSVPGPGYVHVRPMRMKARP